MQRARAAALAGALRPRTPSGRVRKRVACAGLAYLAEVLAAEKAAGFTFTFADASANNVTACKRRLREFRRRAAQAGSAEALLDDPLFEGLLEEDWDDTAGKAEGGRGARDQGSKPGAAPAARGAAARRGAA